MFGGRTFPDGSFAIDYLDDIMWAQKVFMEVVSETRKIQLFTFPVISYCLVYKDNKFLDEKFARWASNHNRKWLDANFFISETTGALSNCPLSSDTKILYWNDYYNQYKLSTIEEIYNNRSKVNKVPVIKTLSNGQEIKCKINKFDIAPEYEITLVNGAKIKTTANHLNKVYNKDYVPTSELTVEDYLPYGLHSYENSDFLTYEEGKLVGAFLGSGSYTERGIVLSLNSDTDRDFMDWLHDYIPRNFGGNCHEDVCTLTTSDNKKCINFKIVSPYKKELNIKDFIEQYVIGDSALTKEINLRVLNYSKNFRKGIIDGWRQTNGDKIHSASKDLIDSMNVVFMSLGMVTHIEEDNELSNNTCYTLRCYNPDINKKLKDVYITDNDYMWVKIKSIERCETNTFTSYCLEVLEDVEPIFTLSNGIITHNCRLLSDTTQLDPFINSIGGTALSVGSVKVSTINLEAIALEFPDNQEKFLEKLTYVQDINMKALDVVRYIIKRNAEKGLLPNITEGCMELDKMFSTCGFLGLWEVMEIYGYTKQDELGNSYYTDEGIVFASRIFDTMNRNKDEFTKARDYKLNLESVPGESAAVKLAAKDRLIYGEEKTHEILSNQWIPLTQKCTLQEKVRLSSLFDKRCGGGCIAHINVEGSFASEESAWKMLKYLAENKVIYFAFNGKINECENHHGFIGGNICPECGGKIIDTYQRIVGYLTPSRNYSRARKQEFTHRYWYDIGNMMDTLT